MIASRAVVGWARLHASHLGYLDRCPVSNSVTTNSGRLMNLLRCLALRIDR